MTWTTGQLRDSLQAAGEDHIFLPVVKKAAVNVKNAWRDSAKGMAHAPAYPYAITFDEPTRGGGFRGSTGNISTQIGPDKDKRQGALGNLIEYGSVHNAPRNHGKAAADAELPAMERALLEAVRRQLW